MYDGVGLWLGTSYQFIKAHCPAHCSRGSHSFMKYYCLPSGNLCPFVMIVKSETEMQFFTGHWVTLMVGHIRSHDTPIVKHTSPQCLLVHLVVFILFYAHQLHSKVWLPSCHLTYEHLLMSAYEFYGLNEIALILKSRLWWLDYLMACLARLNVEIVVLWNSDIQLTQNYLFPVDRADPLYICGE